MFIWVKFVVINGSTANVEQTPLTVLVYEKPGNAFDSERAIQRTPNFTLRLHYMCGIFGQVHSFCINTKSSGICTKITKDSLTTSTWPLHMASWFFGEQQNGQWERLNIYWNTTVG